MACLLGYPFCHYNLPSDMVRCSYEIGACREQMILMQLAGFVRLTVNHDIQRLI
jgi:hypothetical protein